MNITTAIKTARRHIYVTPVGNQYDVSCPYYGLKQVDGPTSASTTSTDYWKARAHCRAVRVGEVVEAVTGDTNYALNCQYDAHARYAGEPWESLARRMVREYNQEAA
jgi:hypothetical protein